MTKMVKMTAHQRGTYGTRHLDANEPFWVSPAYARMWKLSGRASYADPSEDDSSSVTRGAIRTRDMSSSGSTQGSSQSEEDDDDDRDEMRELRVEYEEVLGKRPFPGWDGDELRRRMEEHRSESESDDDSEE